MIFNPKPAKDITVVIDNIEPPSYIFIIYTNLIMVKLKGCGV